MDIRQLLQSHKDKWNEKVSWDQASYSQGIATSDYFFSPFKKADKSILLCMSNYESFHQD